MWPAAFTGHLCDIACLILLSLVLHTALLPTGIFQHRVLCLLDFVDLLRFCLSFFSASLWTSWHVYAVNVLPDLIYSAAWWSLLQKLTERADCEMLGAPGGIRSIVYNTSPLRSWKVTCLEVFRVIKTPPDPLNRKGYIWAVCKHTHRDSTLLPPPGLPHSKTCCVSIWVRGTYRLADIMIWKPGWKLRLYPYLTLAAVFKNTRDWQIWLLWLCVFVCPWQRKQKK